MAKPKKKPIYDKEAPVINGEIIRPDPYAPKHQNLGEEKHKFYVEISNVPCFALYDDVMRLVTGTGIEGPVSVYRKSFYQRESIKEGNTHWYIQCTTETDSKRIVEGVSGMLFGIGKLHATQLRWISDKKQVKFKLVAILSNVDDNLTNRQIVKFMDPSDPVLHSGSDRAIWNIKQYKPYDGSPTQYFVSFHSLQLLSLSLIKKHNNIVDGQPMHIQPLD